jgi:hypothetical protein
MFRLPPMREGDMMDDQDVHRAMADLIVKAAMQFAEGKSKSDVVAGLQNDGYTVEIAEFIAENGEALKRDEFRKSGQRTTLIGTALLGLGTVITAASYSAAPNGGHYVMTTGLIAGGALMLLKGIWRMHSS